MNVTEINIGNCLFRQFKSKHRSKVGKAENLLVDAGSWKLYIQQFCCLHIFLLRGKESCDVIVIGIVECYGL